MIRVEIRDERHGLELAQICELFHQLLHAVPVEEDGELDVFAVALAHEDGAFAVFRVADALAFFEAGGGFWLGKADG